MLLCIMPACRSAPDLPSGYIAVGLESGPPTLDPRFATDASASQIGDLLYDGLTALDDHARRVPHVASSWEMPDAHTYIFHLNAGFTFPDGQLLTAVDVKATYDAVLDVRSRSAKRQALNAIERIEVLGPQTLRFRLRHPFAPFLNETGLGILSAAQVAASPREPLARPAGTGPFRLVEVVPGERVVIERNPAYPLGVARLRGVRFLVVPDGVTRLLQLKRGALDLVQNGIEPDWRDWLQRQPGMRVVTAPGTTVQYLGMNVEDRRLRDVRVRRAIAHAVDRDAIVTTVLKGLATVATGLLPPDHWAYRAPLATYPYDPARAKRLLDEAGYVDPDGDGPARRFRLSYKTTIVALRRRIAEVLQAELAAVGIELDIRSYEWATFYSDIKRGNFHLYSLAWVGIEDPDIYYLTCHSSQGPPEGNNRGAFRDPTIDRLTEAARRATDVGQRRRLYGEVQQRLAELLPVVPLWWSDNVAAMSRRLRGYRVRPNASYAALRQAWIEEP